jgi:hypothetical protein
MNEFAGVLAEDSTGSILPSQYNDLIRRRSFVLDGERRLLWAVLDDAIRCYLANLKCSSPTRRNAFEEVSRWFHAAPRAHKPDALFAFQSICDLLGLDASCLLARLEAARFRTLAMRRHSRSPRPPVHRRRAA